MEDPAMPVRVDPLPLPSSIEELEILIQRFYGPNSPEDYARIDRCLKSVQTSPEGFILADQLMNSPDVNVRFFGALTFTVKINRDGAALLQTYGRDISDRLLFWFFRCVNGGDVAIVVRKLCSALVSFFQQTDGEWTLCVRHAMLCLVAGSLVDYAEAVSRTDVQEIVASLSQSQATACLWLSFALMESQQSLSVNSQWHQVVVRVLKNIPDMLDIVEYCLQVDNSAGQDLAAEAIKLVQVIWASEPSILGRGSPEETRLYGLTVTIVSHLGPNELLSATSELISSTISRGSNNHVKQLVMDRIVSDAFLPYQQQLQDGDFDDDNMIYGRLLVEVGGVLIDNPSFEHNFESQFNKILERLTALAGSQGYPIEDDALSTEVVMFWTSYADWIVELKSIPGAEVKPYQQNWINLSSGYITRVLEAFLRKLQLPPSAVFSTWEKQSQTEFRALRRDFRDFSASAFLLLGGVMLDTLVNYLQRLWAEQNWQGAEITLQCLKGVIEAVIDTETGDAALNTMLTSSIFSPNDTDVPVAIKQASIELVADCSPFLERQSYVPMEILQWLFQALPIPTLGFPAAKAISAICSSCRTRLASNAPALVQLYSTISTDQNRQSEVVERLATAVGAVLQALWAETKNKPERTIAMTALDNLLNTTIQSMSDPTRMNISEFKDQQVTAIQSLVNIAKEFREGHNEVVDLETDELDNKSPDPRTTTWSTTRRGQITDNIHRMLELSPSDGDLTEAVCLLVRAGTTDDLDNPFRIDLNILPCLVTSLLNVTERPNFLLDTVSRWLRPSLAWVNPDDTVGEIGAISKRQRNNVAQACFLQVAESLQNVYRAPDGPRNHAEHISSMMEFLSTYLTTDDIHLLMDTPSLLSLFSQASQVAVQCFDYPEPILKQAASIFWIRLLDVRLTHPEIDATDSTIRNVILHLLPVLTKSLTYALSGSSARSDLDSIVAPFRRLITFPITSQNHSKKLNNEPGFSVRSLLTDALFSSDFPSTKVNEKEKKLFLEKVLRLRGDSAGTARIAKEWWVACRGTFS